MAKNPNILFQNGLLCDPDILHYCYMVLSVLHSIYFDKSDKDITIKLSISHKKINIIKKSVIFGFLFTNITHIIMERKFKQCWSSNPSISTQGTITFLFISLNTNKDHDI